MQTQLAKPSPRPDGNSRRFWEAARERRLSLPGCGACGRLSFPPSPRCRYCLSDRMAWRDLSGRGTVHSFCVMHADFVNGFEVPYVVLQVRLDEQEDLLMLGNLDARWVGKVVIGQEVRAVFEDRGEGVVLPHFEIVGDAAP